MTAPPDPEYVPDPVDTPPAQARRVRGRGSTANPANRFEPISVEPDDEVADLDDDPLPRTQIFRDTSRSIITTNDSPDVGFEASVNPYRGCEHGCAYCYARPTHEYFGLSAGLDFETMIFAKEAAPEQLTRELSSPRWQPKVLAMSGVTDPYQPVERRLGITRGCLEVLSRFRNPVVIITKNHLVTRDIDLLAELARHRAAAVYLSVTTLDDDLRRSLEPRTSSPSRRLEAIRLLAQAGIPTGILMAPIIPGLTEPEIPAVLAAAREAGAIRAGYIVLRLPYQVGPLFEAWLERHRPLARERILARIRSLRGGRLNDPRFGSRMRGEGFHAREIQALFRLAARRSGLTTGPVPLSSDAFRLPPGRQGELFSE